MAVSVFKFKEVSRTHLIRALICVGRDSLQSSSDHDQNNENMRKIKGVTLLKMIKNDRFLKKMTKFSKKLADCACDFEKKDEIFQKSIRFF